jgi:hypothetical protein
MKAHLLMAVIVPGLKMKPWYLLTTDLKLDAVAPVNTYDGRYQIEVNMDEIKEPGLNRPCFLAVIALIFRRG